MSPKLAVKPLTYVETYSCKDCQKGAGWDLERRQGRGCTRPGLPPVRWRLDVRELLVLPSSGEISGSLYRGRDPDPALAGTVDMIPVDPAQPHEPTRDGCPGGWVRTRYVDSVARYTRTRMDNRGRVSNPFFKAAQWQAQEAVLYLEHEQERWHGHIAEHRAKLEARDRKAAERKRKRGSR